MITFDVQKQNDFVHIGHGVNRFSEDFDEWIHLTGSLKDIWNTRHITINTSFISVIFTSDGATLDTGFRIEFTCTGFKKLGSKAPATTATDMTENIWPTPTWSGLYWQSYMIMFNDYNMFKHFSFQVEHS